MYTAQFRDINGDLFTLTIGNSGETLPLRLGGTPFTTSMGQSDDTLYKPVKSQAATIGLIAQTDDYYFGLYTGDAHGNKVTLTDSTGTIRWVGYVTPSLYSIGYTRYLEELSVDCIDGLATLQYYRYTPIHTAADVHTLLDVVCHCIRKCGCYNAVELSAVTKRTPGSTLSVWEECYITERNFITQDPEDTAGEDTKTFLEVLESICLWMGVTAVASGDVVYLIDYDACKNPATHSSIRVDTNGNIISRGVMSRNYGGNDRYTINGQSYAADGTELNLDKVYNKVTVTDEANDLSDLIVDFFSGAENITANDPNLSPTSGNPFYAWGEFIDMTASGGEKMLAMVQPVDGSQTSDKWNAVFLKYYRSNNHTLYNYDSSWNAVTLPTVNFTDTQTYNGAFLVRGHVKELTNIEFVRDWCRQQISGSYNPSTLDEVFAACEISGISFSEYIILTNHTPDAQRTNANPEAYPFISTGAAINHAALFGGQYAFLLIQGNFIWHDQNKNVYPIPEGQVDIGEGRRKITASDAYLPCRLQWGTLYWNGTHWTTTPATFKLWLECEAKRNDQTMYHRRAFVNTVTWRDGVQEHGYKIPLPTNAILLSGAPQLTIFRPNDFSYYRCKVMVLENLKISPMVADPTFSDDHDTETSYTNIINDNHATELDEITFNVCTYDNKTPTLNAVAWYNGTNYYWLDTVYNTAISPGEVGIQRYDGTISDGQMRAEEHLIYRIVNQYSEPAKVLTLTLHDPIQPYSLIRESNLDIDCIVDSVDVDYQKHTYTYKIIQKR